MFTHYRTQGIIFKKNDRGEADRLFVVYTKEFGKLELLAKAVRKIKSKLRSGLDVFYLSEVEFIQGKAQKTLTDAILLDGFKNLRKDLTRLAIARKVAEVFIGLVSGQEKDERLWRLLTETFKRLDAENLRPGVRDLIYHYFVWNFLSLLGYQLDLYHCSLCQRRLVPENIYFSPKEKGLVCSNCQGKIKPGKSFILPLDVIKIIRMLLKKDWIVLARLKIGDEDFASLKTISNLYLRQIE
jgi:DNA repair protein RecO (recombination protein O)